MLGLSPGTDWINTDTRARPGTPACFRRLAGRCGRRCAIPLLPFSTLMLTVRCTAPLPAGGGYRSAGILFARTTPPLGICPRLCAKAYDLLITVAACIVIVYRSPKPCARPSGARTPSKGRAAFWTSPTQT